MTNIRYYIVSQERQVKVAAYTPEEAVALGVEVFRNNTAIGMQHKKGVIVTGLVNKSISVREDVDATGQ